MWSFLLGRRSTSLPGVRFQLMRFASIQLILNGRSGYCFHLNGAFSALLRSLGYNVSRHRGGVQPPGEQPRVSGFHMGLTVTLANEQGEDERWIIDVGLGDMPYEPLPLREGVYEQGPYRYKVTKSDVAANGWRLEHDALSSFVGVDFAPEEVEDIGPFIPKHQHYSRSQDSPWINLFLIRHRHASGGNELRGCIWSKRGKDGVEKIELKTKSEWLDVLYDVFGERLTAYSALEREELWKKTKAIHEDWKKRRYAAQEEYVHVDNRGQQR